ncbi:MAG: PQQ-dependent sugar dehydrogenase, partial [Chromatiaceae bacterium]
MEGHLRRLVAISLTLWVLGATNASAITLQPVGSFDQPIFVTADPLDPNRFFVVEREGAIRLVEDGGAGTFIDLSSIVSCCDGEQGLASMAPAPDFETTGKLYVFYTGEDGPGNLHVDELTAEPDRLSARLSTLRSVLSIPHADFATHNGGQLQFGPDGDLYISTGDGGGSDDSLHNAQSLDSLLGKVLRIDPAQSGGDPYTVPVDNPFAGGAAGDDPIWSYGLRNPFRFSFDRLTGGLAIADVGQGAREEVDWAPSPAPGAAGGAGANYGWNCREGLLPGAATDPECEFPAGPFVNPVFDYPHTDPGGGAAFGCSIIGGYVARDSALGSLYGRYLYTDLCEGDIRSLQLPAVPGKPATNDCSLGLRVSNPVSFGEDAAGRIYVVSIEGGVY